MSTKFWYYYDTLDEEHKSRLFNEIKYAGYPEICYQCLCETKEEAEMMLNFFDQSRSLAYQMPFLIKTVTLDKNSPLYNDYNLKEEQTTFYEVIGYSDLYRGDFMSSFYNELMKSNYRLSYETFNYKSQYDNNVLKGLSPTRLLKKLDRDQEIKISL